MSATSGWTSEPSARARATTSSSAPRERATATTRAPALPSARTSAAPNPRLAPVTSADVPLSSMGSLRTGMVRESCPWIGNRAIVLAKGYSGGMSEELATHLARNIKQLRDMRGLTQQQMAKASGLPRATWANLETGGANPTLSVLHRVASALQVTIEELISRPRTAAQLYPRERLPIRK